MSISKKIKSRIGGISYQRLKNTKTLKNYEDSDDIVLRYFAQYRRYILLEYFFGRVASFYECYETLCQSFSDRANHERFNFKGVYIPKTNYNHALTLINEIGDFFIYFLSDDMELCNNLTREGPYEYGNVYVDVDDIVFDCGANIGLFSGMASKKGAANIYAFEPDSRIIKAYLSKTAKWNPNIKICDYAVSERREVLSFCTNEKGIGKGYLTGLTKRSKRMCGGGEQSIQAISLDEFVHEYNLSRVDFIKADIEGAERQMLKGAKNVLKEFAPKIAICTYHLPDDPEVLRELILDANPEYIIEEKFLKLFAYVPKR